MPESESPGSGIVFSAPDHPVKSASLWTGALGIALIAGGGGFFLGRSTAPESTAASAPAHAGDSPARPARAETRRMTRDEAADLKSRLDRETNPLERFRLAIRNLEAWMAADPRGALDWLKAQEPSSRRNEVIRMALGQFGESDAKGAAEWSMANLSGIELNNALIRVAEQWARQDGLAAANWFSRLTVTPERNAALEGLMFRWATENPEAATAWLRGQASDGELSAILRYAAFAGWAKTDPRGAVRASLESSRAHQDPTQFANTLANWATMDLGASSAWLLENVRDTTERAPAVSELAAMFAHQSPEAGLAWVEKLADSERAAALNRLAAEWADSDPSSAARWLAHATPGELKTETISAILHGFLASDEGGFGRWLASLPPGSLKQQAMQLSAATEPAD